MTGSGLSTFGTTGLPGLSTFVGSKGFSKLSFSNNVCCWDLTQCLNCLQKN